MACVGFYISRKKWPMPASHCTTVRLNHPSLFIAVLQLLISLRKFHQKLNRGHPVPVELTNGLQHASPHAALQHSKSSMYMCMFLHCSTASSVLRPSPRAITSATIAKRCRNL